MIPIISTSEACDTLILSSREDDDVNAVESEGSLEVLESEEDKLQREICKEESRINELYSSRAKIQDSLVEQKEALNSLAKQIEEHKSKIKDLQASYENLSSEIRQSNTVLKKQKEVLDSVREQIQSKKLVCIYAFSSGELEFEGNLDFEIPDTWENIFKVLSQNEEFEVLTIRQLKQLSKLFVLTQAFKEANIKHELIFDSDEIEDCFTQIPKFITP